MTLQTEFRPDHVAASAYIAPGATVLGDVTIGEESSIWFGAVIRGDCEAIRIGKRTNIQDLCVLHADPGYPCTLGDNVTVGHGAIVHGAIIEDDVLIGMKAVVMNGAKIGRGSIVAAGAIVMGGMEVPPGSIVMGQPAKVKGAAEDRHLALIRHAAEHYVQGARSYKSGNLKANS